MNPRKKTKIGILGYGEVGRGIVEFYKNTRLGQHFGGRVGWQVKIKDLKRDDGLIGTEILHICFPWSNNFIKTAEKEIKTIKPKLTIIHSTVFPGTTKKINLLLPKKLKGTVVHSPIRGMHPKLYKGIKTFLKYVGADNKKAGELARKHLETLGIKTKVFQSSVTTEIGKLLDTSYYAICIAWHGEMKKICDKAGVDFEKAVTDFNETYNQGYKKLGKTNVIRPVLYSPKGGIGGHCVIFNTQILKKYYKSDMLDFILKYRPAEKTSLFLSKPKNKKIWTKKRKKR